MNNIDTLNLFSLFGEHSVLCSLDAQNVINVTTNTLTDNIFFKILILGILFYYCYVMINLTKNKQSLIAALEFKYDSEHLFDSSMSSRQDKFLIKTRVLWCLAFAVLSLRLIEFYYPLLCLPLSGIWLSVILFFSLLLIFFLLTLFKRFVLQAIFSLTLNMPFCKGLFHLNSLFLSAHSIFLAPVVILLALYYGKFVPILYAISAFISLFLLILWLFKTYMFFISKKLSLLDWFLYLCTVEILPLSLAYILITKNPV